MINNSKIYYKCSDLFDKLNALFGESMNLARIKFISLMILTLCKVQTVSFYKLSTAFESGAEALSCMRRIQRFMSSYVQDFDIVARLIMALLPHKEPYTLSMDRTVLLILMLWCCIMYENVAFAILFRLLPKRGNSNTTERIEIIDRFIRLFGKSSIESLVGDREFVGEKWLEYLNREGIPYHLRIRENFWVKDPRIRKQFRAFCVFDRLQLKQSMVLPRIYYVNNQLYYLSGARLKNQEGKPEL